MKAAMLPIPRKNGRLALLKQRKFCKVFFFLLCQIFFLKLPKRQLLKIGVGVVFTYIGLVMFLTGFPSEGAGQTSSAFVTALVLALLTGTISLITALIFGRPVGGKTSFPTAKHTQYQ